MILVGVSPLPFNFLLAVPVFPPTTAIYISFYLFLFDEMQITRRLIFLSRQKKKHLSFREPLGSPNKKWASEECPIYSSNATPSQGLTATPYP